MSPYYQFSYASGNQTVHRQVQHETYAVTPIAPATILNMLLVALAGGLLLFYIIEANAIAADQYTTQALNREVQTLSETRMELAQQQAQFENTSVLTSFALEHNMIEAKEVSYLFESGNVAYHLSGQDLPVR